MFGDIGLLELVVILVLVLILFGPGKLPDIKALGGALHGFKKAMSEADEKSPVDSDKNR